MILSGEYDLKPTATKQLWTSKQTNKCFLEYYTKVITPAPSFITMKSTPRLIIATRGVGKWDRILMTLSLLLLWLAYVLRRQYKTMPNEIMFVL